jgi:hypothetical protein
MEKVETASAIIERVNPGLVICRYKPGVKLLAATVAENLKARMSFPGVEPYAVIGVFPEDLDFDMSVLKMDHYSGIALNQMTQMLAIVAEGDLFDTIAQLYLALNPTRFESNVFRTEAEALDWVNERMGRIQDL